MRPAFLLLLLLLPLAAIAADPSVPEAKKDDPSSPTNRVDQWKSTKGNDDLYKGEIKEASFGAEMAVDGASSPTMAVKEAVSQKDSLLLQSNTLTSCLDNSLNGRADELCKESPGHPECMGFNVALENSICRTPGYKPKDDTECKQPNLNDYTAEEWFAFGQQYYAGMQHCGTLKVKAADTNTMRSMNDVATDGKTSSVGQVASVKSDVSGSVPVQNPTTQGSSGASVMPATAVKENGPGILNDGSRHLGYEPGSLLKKAESGESFYSVVMHSPTFEELKESDRAAVEKGLLEPDLVLDKARMAGRLPRLGENLAQYAAATAEAAENPVAEADAEEQSEKLEALPEAPAPELVAAKAEPKPAPLAKAAAAAPATIPAAAPEMLTPVADLLPAAPPAPEEKRPLLLAERIARLEAAAQAARRAKEAGGRGPASLPSLKEEKKPRAKEKTDEKAAEALNLFQRVNRTYQRKGMLLSPAVKASPNFSAVSEKPKLIPDL